WARPTHDGTSGSDTAWGGWRDPTRDSARHRTDSRLRIGSWILPTGPQLVSDLAQHARSELALVSGHEAPHRGGGPLGEHPQRPGEGLDHEVLAVGHEHTADAQRAARIAAAALSAHVQRHGADQRRPAPEPVARACPAQDLRLGQASVAVRLARDRAA